MLEYDRFDISEVVDVKKNNGSRECTICDYRYFLEVNFKFHPELCNVCHDLTQNTVSFNDVSTVSVKGIDYRIHFWYVSKDEATKLLRNADLTEKSGAL